jgi:hypothetical protein
VHYWRHLFSRSKRDAFYHLSGERADKPRVGGRKDGVFFATVRVSNNTLDLRSQADPRSDNKIFANIKYFQQRLRVFSVGIGFAV